jgi:DNA-binding NtrC family response regulator
MTKPQSSTVVVIDDDAEHLAYVTSLLTRTGHNCLGFTNARNALAYLAQNVAELVVTDIFMPDMDGFELLRALRTKYPAVAVVTLSGEGRMTTDFYLECAQHLGAVAALRKPFEPDTLCQIVEQHVTRNGDRTNDPKAGKQPPTNIKEQRGETNAKA